MHINRQLLEMVVDYIKESEEQFDTETGPCRSFEELNNKGLAPDIYHELVSILDES